MPKLDIDNVADNLTYLAETKQKIKTSIKEMGVDVPDSAEFRDYAYYIKQIKGQPYTPPPTGTALTLKIKISSLSGNNAFFSFPLKDLTSNKGFDFWVDWGDGYIQYFKTKPGEYLGTNTYNQPVSHKYLELGEYIIKLNGYNFDTELEWSKYNSYTIEWKDKEDNQGTTSFSYGNSRNKVTEIISWGELELKGWQTYYLQSSNYYWTGFENLLSVPSPLPKSFKPNAIVTLCGNTKLTSIPEDFFDYATERTNFIGILASCIGITSIPQNLLSKCINAKDFQHAFNNTGITEIPSNLFENCKNITTLWSAFRNNTYLQVVPDFLFKNQNKCTNFGEIFYGCSSLINVGGYVFPQNSQVAEISLKSAFEKCTQLTNINSYAFKNCNKVTTIEGLFYECSSIYTLPEGIFDDFISVRNAFNLFAGCSSLNKVSNTLFSKMIELTNIEQLFQGCSNLLSLPTRLFWNNNKIENADYFLGISSSYATGGYAGVTSLPIELFGYNENDVELHFGGYNSSGNTKLKTIPADLFSNFPNKTDFSRCFYGCTALQEIPDELFAKNNRSLTFQSCFYGCTGLTKIGNNIFGDLNRSLNDYAADEIFRNCTSLKELPSKLLSGFKRVSTFKNTFRNCDGLTTLPADLFPENLQRITLDSTFRACDYLSNIPENLFDNLTNLTHLKGTFASCISLNTIPSNLFKNNLLLETLDVEGEDSYGVFQGCTNLTNIGSGLFDNNIRLKTTKSTFKNCKNLMNIPNNLFTNNVNLSNISNLFEGCNNLLNIPENLFFNSLNISSLNNLFADCSSLAEIPDNTFPQNDCTAASLEKVFYNCSSLKTIPSNIFDYFANVTTLEYLFSGCSSLESVNSILFNNLSNVKYINYLFTGCSSLTEIPSGLFNNNWQLEQNISGLFRNCTKLSKLPSKLFGDNPYIIKLEQSYSGTEYDNFYNTPMLSHLPDNLLDGLINLTSLRGFFRNSNIKTITNKLFGSISKITNLNRTFSGSKLTSVPQGIFDNFIKLDDLYGCFMDCSSLTEIPSGLFKKNINVTNFSNTFDGTPYLKEIPSDLFPNNNEWGNQTSINFQSCFYCNSDNNTTGTVQDIWNIPNKTLTGTNCFRKRTNLTNYNDIPSSWK